MSTGNFDNDTYFIIDSISNEVKIRVCKKCSLFAEKVERKREGKACREIFRQETGESDSDRKTRHEVTTPWSFFRDTSLTCSYRSLPSSLLPSKASVIGVFRAGGTCTCQFSLLRANSCELMPHARAPNSIVDISRAESFDFENM